jgi:Flp pilus assembly protein TadG
VTRVGHVRVRRADTGAAAVEFALVAIPLFALLFGIIQYGFVFYQLQGASAVVRQSASWAAEGIDDCATWQVRTLARAENNGVTSNLSPAATADFRTDADGNQSVLVTLSFSPLQLVPLVPVPATVTRTAEVDVENLPYDGIRNTKAGAECT